MREFNREKYPFTLPDDRIDGFNFHIRGEAVGQGRPRATTINGHTRMYQPKKSVDYQNLVKLLAQEKMCGKNPFIGQVSVTIFVYKSVPKSYPQWLKDALLSSGVRSAPMTKPDADNIAKAILDGMTGIVYKDDTQVTDLSVYKSFSKADLVSVLVRYNATLNGEDDEKKEEETDGEND